MCIRDSVGALCLVLCLSFMPILIFQTDEGYAELSVEAKFGMSLVPMLATFIGWKTVMEFEKTGVLTTY